MRVWYTAGDKWYEVEWDGTSIGGVFHLRGTDNKKDIFNPRWWYGAANRVKLPWIGLMRRWR